ncbi:MAG: Gfo/Idh/MocA family protein [Bryobacteraceae bacterium]
MKRTASRRSFLQAAVGFPLIVPASVLGKDGAVPPSDRVTLGLVGTGWQGINNVNSFLREPRARIVALCDIDRTHLDEALALVNKETGNAGCRTYHEMEELFARPDIDAVALTLPDHWHGIASLAALRAGKDVYGEKPIAHNWAEGRVIADAARRTGRVWQTGSWQRSRAEFRFACELVRNGRIGKVRRVEVGLPGGHTDFDGLGHLNTPQRPPETLDWDRWLGPAPKVPYCPARVHKTWRWNYDYGGGMLLDWVGHHVDIAHWALDLDRSGPVEVSATGEFSAANPVWDTPVKFRVTAKYADGVTMLISGGYDDVRMGAKFIGEEGWIWVDRSGIEAEPRSLLAMRIRGEEKRLRVSNSHHGEFLDCVRSRRTPLTPAETALRSATPGYLGLIAIRTGRTIRWDPVREVIIDDSEAQRYLSRPMRAPWRL